MDRVNLVHKRGRKYLHGRLYLQSINSIKHQLRRHLGFGVFIAIWSMVKSICCFRYLKDFDMYQRMAMERERAERPKALKRAR
jgi:hypothetical protein